MDNFLIFLTLATVTVLSPGPGVLLTLSNAVRYGFSGAIGGILGVACGTFAVAVVSATSLGLLLSVSTMAFTLMKYIGAAYLIYLGIKMLCFKTNKTPSVVADKRNEKMRFFEGMGIQVTNPKAVFFFMSIFPQFVDYSGDFVGQFAVLVLTYSGLVIIIHMIYAFMAESARHLFSTPRCIKFANKVGGGTFILFGVGLATANK